MQQRMKKALRETQNTVRAGCSKVRTPPTRLLQTDRTNNNTLRC